LLKLSLWNCSNFFGKTSYKFSFIAWLYCRKNMVFTEDVEYNVHFVFDSGVESVLQHWRGDWRTQN
jgi:hypothetical protein